MLCFALMWCALVKHRVNGAHHFIENTAGRPDGCVDLGGCWPIEDPILIFELLGEQVCLGACIKQNAGRVLCVASVHQSDTFFQAIQACCLGCIFACIKYVLCIICELHVGLVMWQTHSCLVTLWCYCVG